MISQSLLAVKHFDLARNFIIDHGEHSLSIYVETVIKF